MSASLNPWLEQADRYIDGGAVHAFPVPRGSKSPKSWAWTKRKLTADDLNMYFGNPDTAYNIGIALGTYSPCNTIPKRLGNGLIDIDLDWPHAATFADILFSDCPSFGRKSKPRSHRILYAAGLKTAAFKLPNSVKGHACLPNEHAVCIAEIRSTGAYTVFPYSTHESGEVIDWEDRCSPPTLEAEEVRRRTGLVSFCALAAQMFPPEGNRNNYCFTLLGAMAHANVEPELATKLVRTIATDSPGAC